MVAVMREPQEIEDEEYEQVLARVAAVDVARAPGMVCTRVPHESRPGKRRTRVREVSATANAVLELAGHLAGEGIGKVTLEATVVIRGSNLMKLDIALVGPWRTRLRR
jgi:transposase